MTSSKLKVALAASLALNLFIVGAVAGAAGMQARLSKKVPESSTRGNTSALMRAAEVLPEGKREQYHARLKAEGERAQSDFRAARAARVKASAMIAAPDFDQAGISALLAEARSHDVRARTRFEGRSHCVRRHLDAGRAQGAGRASQPGLPSARPAQA